MVRKKQSPLKVSPLDTRTELQKLNVKQTTFEMDDDNPWINIPVLDLIEQKDYDGINYKFTHGDIDRPTEREYNIFLSYLSRLQNYIMEHIGYMGDIDMIEYYINQYRNSQGTERHYIQHLLVGTAKHAAETGDIAAYKFIRPQSNLLLDRSHIIYIASLGKDVIQSIDFDPMPPYCLYMAIDLNDLEYIIWMTGKVTTGYYNGISLGITYAIMYSNKRIIDYYIRSCVTVQNYMDMLLGAIYSDNVDIAMKAFKCIPDIEINKYEKWSWTNAAIDHNSLEILKWLVNMKLIIIDHVVIDHMINTKIEEGQEFPDTIDMLQYLEELEQPFTSSEISQLFAYFIDTENIIGIKWCLHMGVTNYRHAERYIKTHPDSHVSVLLRDIRRVDQHGSRCSNQKKYTYEYKAKPPSDNRSYVRQINNKIAQYKRDHNGEMPPWSDYTKGLIAPGKHLSKKERRLLQ